MADLRLARRAFGALEAVAIVALFAFAARLAYTTRLYAIETYGRVIHEFDPWFNMRATSYLAENGAAKFFTWFDYESWYPLGRPVGTTIYPGMQFTSVAIWAVLRHRLTRSLFGLFGVKMGAVLGFLGLRGKENLLNDICVYVPAWFGGVASVVLGLLTREVSGSWRAGAIGALVMSVVPAHLMRSIGGGYDNESVAVTAMCLTFLLWTRSLRVRGSLASAGVWGVLAGLASFYMAASWGGYVFVVNLVGMHAAALFMMGQFSPALWLAYSCWFVVGAGGAMTVPVIGQAPIRSLEQAGPLLVFLAFQFCGLSDLYSLRAHGKSWPKGSGVLDFADRRWREMASLRFQSALAVGAVGAAFIAWLASTGFFGPLSVRVRALFIKHTKTGNPLVDSVAEHQAASSEAYWHHLHYSLYMIPAGLVLAVVRGCGRRAAWALPFNGSDSLAPKWFIVIYFLVAYYFANKMSRLILLMGPVAAALSGIAVAWLLQWACTQVLGMMTEAAGFPFNALVGGDAAGFPLPAEAPAEALEAAVEPEASVAEAVVAPAAPATASALPATPMEAAAAAAAKGSSKKVALAVAAAGPKTSSTAAVAPSPSSKGLTAYLADLTDPVFGVAFYLYTSGAGKVVRVAAAVAVFWYGARAAAEFYKVSDAYAHQISHPSLMFKAKLQDGSEVMVNDYQEAYWWLRDNTPADSRVMSWWDYGYQINGIAKRTTIADGNTWNLEHIAMLGRMLTAPEKKAHSLVRLLADYVLIWTGGGGDDLAKSPHMARISSSVFDDVCGPRDPLCQNFGFYSEGRPTKSMEASMLYKMHSADLPGKGVTIDKRLFQEAFKSKFGLVRIWKVMNVSADTRAWLADPANRACDRPGSWFCPGAYPPPSITGGIDLAPPSTHRHLNYDDPGAYVEDRKAQGAGQKRAPAPKKAAGSGKKA